MKKFAALAGGLTLAVLAIAAPALAQGSGWGGQSQGNGGYQAAPRGNDDLDGGPAAPDRGFRDPRDPSPQFRNGGWDRPDAVGRTAAFFSHPRLDGGPVTVQYLNGYRSNARQAEERATDNFCRRVGYREGAYYSIDRSRRGAVLEDVLCVR